MPVGLHRLNQGDLILGGDTRVLCPSVAAEWTPLCTNSAARSKVFSHTSQDDLRSLNCKQVDTRLHRTYRYNRWTVSLSFVNGLKKETVAQQW